MTRVIPRRWTVSCRSVADQPLLIHCAGQPLTQSAPATLDNVSPVEYLLVAIATCFALSCRAALKTRQLPLVALEVAVEGEKAPDQPSRLAAIRIAVRFDAALGEADATAVTTEAKSLCTVTNTLAGQPSIKVELNT